MTTRILNYGSLNIDQRYRVPHFARPGETLHSTGYRRSAGGKGLNQSLALAYAGAAVSHAGKVGPDGWFLVEMLQEAGVNTDAIVVANELATGHAIIQVDDAGENSIVLHAGANHAIEPREIAATLAGVHAGDILLLQNEINHAETILHEARARGARVAMNPAPMTPDVERLPLVDLALLIVNSHEGRQPTGEDDPTRALRALQDRCPQTAIVLTRGSDGAHYVDSSVALYEPAPRVVASDTTGAGDTFVGYLLAVLSRGGTAREALELATPAAAVCFTRPGAADAIPRLDEI